MHKSCLGGLIIDCKTDDLEREARFWGEALGYEILPSDDPDATNYLGLATRDGEPYIEIQSVEHPSRVHLDIKTDDLEAEVRRLERLGATRIKKVKHWWVLEAPSGHRFCVIPLHKGQHVGRLNSWEGDS
jgi:hypothetical protein